MKYIIGADEVGTGSLASSFLVCGVKAEENWKIPGLNDSKKLSDLQKEKLNEELLKSKDIEFFIVEKSNLEIDSLGLGVCLKQAYHEIADKLLTPDDRMIIDGKVRYFRDDKRELQITMIIKADSSVYTVMAASIIAKVARDHKLYELAKKYPEYGFENHVGYGTKAHKEAIKKYGLCEIHRKSYKINLE